MPPWPPSDVHFVPWAVYQTQRELWFGTHKSSRFFDALSGVYAFLSIVCCTLFNTSFPTHDRVKRWLSAS